MKLRVALFCLQASAAHAFAPALQRTWTARVAPVAAEKEAVAAYKKAEVGRLIRKLEYSREIGQDQHVQQSTYANQERGTWGSAIIVLPSHRLKM
jgi:hypothetical protein